MNLTSILPASFSLNAIYLLINVLVVLKCPDFFSVISIAQKNEIEDDNFRARVSQDVKSLAEKIKTLKSTQSSSDDTVFEAQSAWKNLQSYLKQNIEKYADLSNSKYNMKL